MSGLLTPETLAQLTASISPCGSLDIRTILGLTPSPRFSPSNVSPLNFGIISTPVARPINPEPMDFDISTPPNLHELTPVSLGNGSNQVEQVDRASIQAEAVDINSHQAEAVDIGSHQAEAVDIGSHQAEDVDIGCRQAEAVDTMTIESSFLQTLNTFCKVIIFVYSQACSKKLNQAYIVLLAALLWTRGRREANKPACDRES